MYRPLQLYERSQLFIGTHDELLSVAVRVHNPDRSPFEIESCDPAWAPTGFVEIVSTSSVASIQSAMSYVQVWYGEPKAVSDVIGYAMHSSRQLQGSFHCFSCRDF